MTFFTLAAHLGTPCSVEGPEFIAKADGEVVLDWMARIVDGMDARCCEMDPIAVLDLMGEPDCPYDVAPFIYGYVSYSFAGFRPARIAFADMPVVDGRAPHGSALGGTGIAVSAKTQAPEEAKALCALDRRRPGASGRLCQRQRPARPFRRLGQRCRQRGGARFLPEYARHIGGAYVRPRHDGYMAFQSEASDIITHGLRTAERHTVLLDKLNRLFAQSFEG